MPAEPKTKEKRGTANLVFLAVALIIAGAPVVYLHQIYLDAPLEGGDNAEWREEVAERDTLLKVVDFRIHSGRPGHSAYYAPVQMAIWKWLTETYDYETEPRPYHYVCLAIHLLNLTVMTLLAFRLVRRRPHIILAALSFGVFYPNIITSGWVAGTITTGTSCFFGLLAILFFIYYFEDNQKRSLALSALAYFLSLFTKEYAIFLIPIMAMYYITNHRPRVWKFLKSDLVILPHIVVTIPMAFIVISRLGRSAIVNDWGGFNFSHHMAYRFADYVTFLMTQQRVMTGYRVAAVALFLVLIPVVVHLARKDKQLAFLGSWFVIAMSVYVFSNFRDPFTLARYIYTPSIPWFLCLFRLMHSLWPRRSLVLLMPLCAYSIGFSLYLYWQALPQ